MRIAVDLGYGYIKGIAENGERIIFPSVVGSGRDLSHVGLFGANALPEYHVWLKGAEGEARGNFLVGVLAQREARDLSRPFDDDKIDHPSTRALVATAAYLLTRRLEPGSSIHLATGLPFRHYRSQKERFRDNLADLALQVQMNGHGDARTVAFERVTVFPQAAGAFYSCLLDGEGRVRDLGLLQKGGLIGIVDVGYKTTDYVVVDLDDGLALRENMSGTVEAGVSTVWRMVQSDLEGLTGVPINQSELERAFRSGALHFRGRDYPVGEMANQAKKLVARAIMDAVQMSWGDRAHYLRTVYLAGGGALEMQEYLWAMHHRVEMVPDPQYANAAGFLAVAAKVS